MIGHEAILKVVGIYFSEEKEAKIIKSSPVGLILLLFIASVLSPALSQESTVKGPRGDIMYGPKDPISQNLGLDELDLKKAEQRQGDIPQYPTNSRQIIYRGVVSADVNASDSTRDELICDFGSAGVWVLDGPYSSLNWHQISGANPDWMISIFWNDPGDEEIVADFGSLGLWAWNYSGYPGQWLQLSTVNAEQGFSVNDDLDDSDELYVDFGSLGLWRYDYAGSFWYQMSSLNPNHVQKGDIWDKGWEEGVFSFPGVGVFNVFVLGGSGPTFTQLSGTPSNYIGASADFGIGDASDELALSFSSGIWLLDDPGAYPAFDWHLITSKVPYGFREVRFGGGETDYELVADFITNDGFWYWDYAGYPGTWILLSPEWVGGGYYEPFDPDAEFEASGDEEVAVDFMSLGLWLFNHSSGGWVQLSSANPDYMVRADIYADTKYLNEGLVVSFSGLGLWVYDGYLNLWYQISGLNPDYSP